MGFISSLSKYKFSIFIVFVLQFLGLISSNAKLLGETELPIFLILIIVYFIYLGWRASKKFNYTTKDAGMVGAGVGIASSLLLGIFLIIISLIVVFGLIQLGEGIGAVFGGMASESGQLTTESGAQAGGAVGTLIGTLLLMVVLITTVLNTIAYAIVGFIFSFLGGFLSTKIGTK